MRKIYLLFLILLIPLSSIFSQCEIFVSTIDVSCGGDADGVLEISMSNGVEPFNFTVNGIEYESQDSFLIISNLEAGLYEIIASDDVGCEVTTLAQLDSPAPLTIVNTVAVNNCGEEVCIDLSVFGGVAPYTFLWPTGQTSGTSICDFFAQGVYSVTVTDANGCTNIGDVVVEEGGGLTEVNIEVSEINCNSAVLSAVVNPGAAILFYEWSNGATGSTITVSEPGTYFVFVVDSSGCAVQVNYTFVGDPSFTGSIEINQNNSCAGDENGQLTVTTDGIAPLTYAWSNGASTATIDGLVDGFYQVTVSENDPNSCPLILNINLQSTNPLDASVIVQNEDCNGAAGGSIILNIIGGTPDYTFNWSDLSGSDNPQIRTDLFPGVYQVTVTDANGCTLVLDGIVVQEPFPIEAFTVTTNVSCFGGSDGSVFVDASNGSGVFSFSWSNGVTTQDVYGLSTGSYTVTITDDNGCSLVESVFISESPELSATISGSTEVCTNNGSLTVSASGGTPPYAYNWYAGLGNTAQIFDLVAGYYDVTVVDANGCYSYASTTINSNINLDLTSTFADCNMDNGTATVAVVNGASDPSYAWSNGASGATLTDLAPDWYSVTVTDAASGCIVHNNIEVQEDTICYVLISGYILVDDENQDCMEDDTTVPIGNALVELSDGQITFTNALGYYEFETDAGTYTVTPNVVPVVFEDLCSDLITVSADVWGNQYGGNNFYYKFGTQKDVALQVNKPNARPGFIQTVSICLLNNGAVPVTGTVTFVHSDVQSLSQTNPQATSYDAMTRTISWDYEDIPVGAIWIYKANLYTPIGTDLGTLLSYEFTADPITGDLTPEDNTIVCTEVVTGSYDPNDKAVTPAGIGEDGIISMDDNVLNYKIRFQNTGTDTAFTVVIRDEIDANLDVRSIVPGPSSHAYQATIKDGNVLELLFENILLPDSFVNEPASNGFVFFDIHVKAGSEYGTRIENTAEIYFDFNEPIITNTVVNTIQMISSRDDLIESQISLDLLPNPMKEESVLQYNLNEAERVQIKLFDVLGNQVKVLQSLTLQQEGDHELRIDQLNIPEGIYFIRLETKNGWSSSIKMLKLNN